LPEQNGYKSDITLSTLIHKKQLNTKEQLDSFIDKWIGKVQLKFSTLCIANEWCRENQKVDYLDNLDSEYVVLFNEILGQIYRGQIIKRYDKIINFNAYQSYKCHVDGEIKQSWVRSL
jgi:hypothetical protein